MKNLILVTAASFLLVGCASMSDTVITEGLDEAGNVTKTIASANTVKTTSLYDAHVNIAKQTAKVNSNAGFSVDIYGLSKTETANGEPVYFAQVRINNKPVVVIDNKLPERIPDHWSKDVAIQAFKYGFYAFGVDTFGNVISSLMEGTARGLTVEGDGNIIQGNQNKAGGDQDIRADYVTCATGECGSDSSSTLSSCISNPPGGYNSNGIPMYSDTLSCDSYFGG